MLCLIIINTIIKKMKILNILLLAFALLAFSTQASYKIVEIHEHELKPLIEGKELVIVKFFAEWW